MDKFRIDSHKLMFHPARVSDWLKGENIYPIYAEMSPSGACNHRCVYCALDFMEYKPRFLDTQMLKTRLTELAGLGLKSVMFAGEGEPFLHRDMPQIAVHAKDSGIDVSFTTNAALFFPEKADICLEKTAWLKVSINAGTPKTYAAMHRTKEEDFNIVLRNMEYAAKLKAKRGLSCTLGMQMILLPDNAAEAETLAKTAKAAGMSYLVIKPYSQHPLSKTNKYKSVKYTEYAELAEKLRGYNTKDFSVIFRLNTMHKWDEADKPYKRCLALPFWTYIDAGGNVWGCSMFLGDERMRYGNINETPFREIWEGEKRKKSLAYVADCLDAGKCRLNCRMDEINRYLWELKNPSEHVNFI